MFDDNDIVNFLIDLGKKIDRESNITHDLWTWLPSYDIHGDTPKTYDVMKEACNYIHDLQKELEELRKGEGN